MSPTRMGASGMGWSFPIVLAVLLVGLVVAARWIPHSPRLAQPLPSQQGLAAGWQPSPQPSGDTVSLEIDYGNGAKKKFAALAWQQGMTVANLLAAARNFRPGLEFTQVGDGETGFLSSLDGLANQGASGSNWIYQVDGQYPHVSFCLEKIEPRMHILWTFTDDLYNTEAPSNRPSLPLDPTNPLRFDQPPTLDPCQENHCES